MLFLYCCGTNDTQASFLIQQPYYCLYALCLSSAQAPLSGLDDVHPHWGGQSILPSPPIQTLIPLKHPHRNTCK